MKPELNGELIKLNNVMKFCLFVNVSQIGEVGTFEMDVTEIT